MYPRKKNAVHRHVRSIVGNDQDDDTDYGHVSHPPQWMSLTDCLVLLYKQVDKQQFLLCTPFRYVIPLSGAESYHSVGN